MCVCAVFVCVCVNVVLCGCTCRQDYPHIHSDVADRAEACAMLHTIRELREEHTTSSPQLMVPVYHTLGMLHTILGEHDKVGVLIVTNEHIRL